MKSQKNPDMLHFLNQQIILAALMGIDIDNMSDFSEWIEKYSQRYRELYNTNEGVVTVEMLHRSE